MFTSKHDILEKHEYFNDFNDVLVSWNLPSLFCNRLYFYELIFLILYAFSFLYAVSFLLIIYSILK